MSGRGLFYVRSTRLVAGARAVLVAFLAVGVMFGPLAPSLQGDLVRPLIGGYLAYSLVLLAFARSRRFAYRVLRQPLAPTLIDLAVFTALFYMTTGAESPFFSPLVFLIVSATIQWGSRGAILMSLVIFAVLLPAGWSAAFGAGRDDAAALSWIVRLGHIVMVAVLLSGFGRHFERLIEELSRMADPVEAGLDETRPPTTEALDHALRLFRARRGVALWAEADEPYLNVVEADGGAHTTRVLPPNGDDDWLVAPGLEGSVFLYDRASDITITRPDGPSQVVKGPPVAPSFLATLEFERMLVLPMRADPLDGVILVLDQFEPASEDLAFGTMASAQISTALQRWHAQMTHRAAAATAERVRLSRDLHDGVLQFLAGAAIQLEALLQAGKLPVGAKVRLMGLRQAVGDEQRELRSFITALQPARSSEKPKPVELGDELEELADHLSRYWNVNVVAELNPRSLLVSVEVAYDVGRIVREAVANAVRHGRARHVTITGRMEGERLQLEIADDGRGFGFQGEMLDEELQATAVGPRSLQERVRSLGGRVGLASSSRGARVGIDLPIERLAA